MALDDGRVVSNFVAQALTGGSLQFTNMEQVVGL